MQPKPRQDVDRMDRVVDDIAETMRFSSVSPALRERLEKWVNKTIAYIYRRGPWWWLENSAGATIPEFCDVIDLCGEIAYVRAIYAPGLLRQTSYQNVVNLRARARAESLPNGGEPTAFALEGGWRCHLWPCPAEETRFAVLYDRPIDISLLPFDWDGIIHDGAVGLFGRHYDKSGLVDDPQYFERRFQADLRRARANALPGVQVSGPYCASSDGTVTVDARSALPRPVLYVVPQSVADVPGMVSLEIPSCYDTISVDDPVAGGVVDPCAQQAIYYSAFWGYDGSVEYVDPSLCGIEEPLEESTCPVREYSSSWGYDGLYEYVTCLPFDEGGGYVAPPDPEDIPAVLPPPVVPDYTRRPNQLNFVSGELISLPFGAVFDASLPWEVSVYAQLHQTTEAVVLGEHSGNALSDFYLSAYGEIGGLARFALRIGSGSSNIDILNAIGVGDWIKITISVDPGAQGSPVLLTVENIDSRFVASREISEVDISLSDLQSFMPPTVIHLGSYGASADTLRIANVRINKTVPGGNETAEGAYWPIDEGATAITGSAIFDQSISGNAFDGVVEDLGSGFWDGDAWFRNNAWLLFDGTETLALLPWNPVGITWQTSFWALRILVHVPDEGVIHSVVRTNGTSFGDSDHFYVGLIFGEPGDAYARLEWATFSQILPVIALPSGRMDGGVTYQVDIVYQSGATDTVSVYAKPAGSEAVADVQAGASFTGIPTSICDAFVPPAFLQLGTSGADRYKGWIRDCRFTAFYYTGSPTWAAYWPMDDTVGDGGVLMDRSGNNNHGELVTLGAGVWQIIN